MNEIREQMLRRMQGIREELTDTTENNYPFESVADWMKENVLDTEYTVDSSLNVTGAKMFIDVGGPNIYIDTRAYMIVGNWGTEHAQLSLDDEIIEYLEDSTLVGERLSF